MLSSDVIPNLLIRCKRVFYTSEGKNLNNIRKILGLRIKELRLAKKMKQAELAEIIGIEPRSVSKIESGFHFPKDEHLFKIANALNVEVKDLFTNAHLSSREDLINKINDFLKSADDETIKKIYRIIEAVMI